LDISSIDWKIGSYKARMIFKRLFGKHEMISLSMTFKTLSSHGSDGSLGSLEATEITLPNTVTLKIFYSA
jgi:hypothetical protein